MKYKKFEYSATQDTYTREDVTKLVEMFNKYQDKFSTEYDALIAEVEPIRLSQRKDRLVKLIPKEANTALADDIISLTKLNDEMDDTAIAEAFRQTVSARDFLKAPVIDDEVAKKVERQVKPETTKKEDKPNLTKKL